MTTAQNKSAAIFSATVAALATLIVSFLAFRWGFIHLWEWQHEGRRMVFVFEPDMKAAVLAISSGVAVFFMSLRRSSHNSKP
jgi:hypothetical protein